MKSRLKYFIIYLTSHQWIIFSLLLIIAFIISIHNISLGINNFWGGDYTYYNNFLIFKNSFAHLIENKNLYDLYLNEYADFYKYSPTFAFAMGALYYLPDSIGLVIWNSLNIFILYYALNSIKSIDPSKKLLLVLFILFELILNSQNSQSNAIIAGLTIITFNMFEKGKNTQATLFIALGTFIKIFSVMGCLFILLYPKKLKSTLALIIWLSSLFFLPLLMIDLSDLLWQYKNWYSLLKTDQNESIGMSVFAYTQLLLPLKYFKSTTLILGLFILITPLLKIRLIESQGFRIQYLSMILIWMVLFNYKAESPTYVIAMSGIGIWFFTSKQSNLNLTLVILTIIFTSIWVTDIVPRSIKNNVIDLKFIKSFFPLIILLKIYFEVIIKNVHNKTPDKLPD